MRVASIVLLAACSKAAPPMVEPQVAPVVEKATPHTTPRPLDAGAIEEVGQCAGRSPSVQARAVGATEAALLGGLGSRVVDIGCHCLGARARHAVVWVAIDQAHRIIARAWSDREEVTPCFAKAFEALTPAALAKVTGVIVYEESDRSRAVKLPGPFTSNTLELQIVGDTSGRLPTSELDTMLAVASQEIVRCAATKPTRAVVRVDIQDSKFVDAEVASELGVDHACVRAALVGRTFFRSKLDAALVLDVGWRD